MNLATSRARVYSPPPTDRREASGGGKAVETPYIRARRERDALLGTALANARNWRVATASIALLLAIALAGNIYLATKSTVVPHIIEVDSLGAATYRGPVGGGLTPTEAMVRYQLSQFIELTRTVSSDTVLFRQRLLDANKMLSVTGHVLYEAWGNATNPIEQAKTKTTAVAIVSAVPLSKETWQIDWQEREWDRAGTSLGRPLLWRAMLKIVQQEAKTAQQLIDNPVGVYIDEFHWDRLLPMK